jgi:hypothetical protein
MIKRKTLDREKWPHLLELNIDERREVGTQIDVCMCLVGLYHLMLQPVKKTSKPIQNWKFQLSNTVQGNEQIFLFLK